MGYVEHKMCKAQCAACNRKNKDLSNATHLLRWAGVMTVIVTMDQNRRKIKMRNKAKQDKIVLGCDDVS